MHPDPSLIQPRELGNVAALFLIELARRRLKGPIIEEEDYARLFMCAQKEYKTCFNKDLPVSVDERIKVMRDVLAN